MTLISRTFYLMLMFMIAACDRQDRNEVLKEKGSGEIQTTFYPTEYFVQRMIDEPLKVVCPVPDDADAIFWMPGREALEAYQGADMIVLNGAGFAKWVNKVSLPDSRVVDSAAGFSDQFLTYENAIEHQHGPAGSHAHEGVDGHTWVDPNLAILQVDTILKALQKRWPSQEPLFHERAEALKEDLEKLDARFVSFSKRWGSLPLFASHPAYNYVVKRYGWNLRNLDLDPEVMPDDATFVAIAEMQEQHPARVLIWEGEPLPEVARRMEEELGLKSVTFSPVELLSREERESGSDYLSLMNSNLDRLEGLRDGDAASSTTDGSPR